MYRKNCGAPCRILITKNSGEVLRIGEAPASLNTEYVMPAAAEHACSNAPGATTPDGRLSRQASIRQLWRARLTCS
jgi:hypothetical protein